MVCDHDSEGNYLSLKVIMKMNRRIRSEGVDLQKQFLVPPAPVGSGWAHWQAARAARERSESLQVQVRLAESRELRVPLPLSPLRHSRFESEPLFKSRRKYGGKTRVETHFR